jgi:glycosyltransferase involved in cell wall biosynthesis
MINDLKLLAHTTKLRLQNNGSKKRVGFVRPRFTLYSLAMASTRLRVYDPILWFTNDAEYILELFNPRQKYDVVIFQKYFDDTAYALAESLQQSGTVIVLDINVNYYNAESDHVDEVSREQVCRFTELADYVIAVSPRLKSIIDAEFPNKNVRVIEEAIPEKFFSSTVVPTNPPKTLLWMGYSWKVKELNLIKELLSELSADYGLQLITIGGKTIDLGAIQVKQFPYREWTVHKKMQAGDVFISPRDLTDPYNLTHAFTKIGVPMAMGMPVVASPIPSYEGSPALLCETEEEWRQTLTKIAAGEYDLKELSQRGIDYVWEHYHPEKIKADYRRLFDEIATV